MSDNSFPGFEEDQPAKPAKPANPANPAMPAAPATPGTPSKPARPAAAPAVKPATGAISAANAQPPALAGASGPVAFEFEAAEPSAPKKPAFVPPASSAGAPAGAIDRSPPPAPAGGEDVDPDVKPGSRKDLWNCPHCGTGNRPGRDTCRSCGKSPDEVVVVPWTKKPVVWIAGAAGVIVVLVLLITVAGHTDMTYKPAEVESIDKAVRVGGSAGTDKRTIIGQDFIASHQLTVCGRVIGSSQLSSVAGGWTVALLLGKAAVDADAAQSAKVDFDGDHADISGVSGRTLVLHLMPGGQVTATFKPKTGALMSIMGDCGELDGLSNNAGEYTVYVTQVQQN